MSVGLGVCIARRAVDSDLNGEDRSLSATPVNQNRERVARLWGYLMLSATFAGRQERLLQLPWTSNRDETVIHIEQL